MKYLAKEVYYNYRIYQHFLIENNLDDDSNSISVEDLMEYIENHIDEDDKKRLSEFCLQAY